MPLLSRETEHIFPVVQIMYCRDWTVNTIIPARSSFYPRAPPEVDMNAYISEFHSEHSLTVSRQRESRPLLCGGVCRKSP